MEKKVFRKIRLCQHNIAYDIIEGYDSAFFLTPKNIEQPLQKRRLPFLPARDNRLALSHVVLQVIVPIAQEVIEFFLPTDEEGGVADLFR